MRTLLRTRTVLAGGLLAALSHEAAPAQQSEPAPAPAAPKTTPAQPAPGSDPGVDRIVGELERAGARRPAIEPVGTVSPAAAAGQARAPAQSRLVPQGTFLPSRQGRLITAGQHAVFVFAPDAEGHTDPPMIVLPSGNLASMDRHVQERGPDAVFTVTGQVFAYHDHNYLLITEAHGAAAPPPAPAARGPSAAPPAEARSAVADPAVEKILADLREAGGHRTVEPIAAAPRSTSSGEGGARASLVPEGTFLAARRGRAVRAAGGEWLLAFDADAQGRSEPPMGLMPCQNLANIESTAQQRGEAVTFTISGQVFVYRDRNYLLPTMFIINRRTDEVVPTQ